MYTTGIEVEAGRGDVRRVTLLLTSNTCNLLTYSLFRDSVKELGLYCLEGE